MNTTPNREKSYAVVDSIDHARFIAKSLNCTEHDDPNIQPCHVCKSCKEISKNCHVDVIERDASLITDLDPIRQIIESMRYTPVSARRKFYIIYEADMLSERAFKALKNALKEAPEHVRFIFVTDAPSKLPL